MLFPLSKSDFDQVMTEIWPVEVFGPNSPKSGKNTPDCRLNTQKILQIFCRQCTAESSEWKNMHFMFSGVELHGESDAVVENEHTQLHKVFSSSN